MRNSAPIAALAVSSAALGLCLTAGCSRSEPTVGTTYTVTGVKAYTVSCPGQTWIACQSVAGNACGSKGFEVVNQSEDGDLAHRALMVTCGESAKEIRSRLEAAVLRLCPATDKSSGNQFVVNGKPVKPEMAEVYGALIRADAAATAAKRELALRDGVDAIQSGKSGLAPTAATVCCSDYEVISRFSKPGMDPEFAKLSCETGLSEDTSDLPVPTCGTPGADPKSCNPPICKTDPTHAGCRVPASDLPEGTATPVR